MLLIKNFEKEKNTNQEPHLDCHKRPKGRETEVAQLKKTCFLDERKIL